MIIPINDQYRLFADEHSWAIQKHRRRKDRNTTAMVSAWESFLFFTNPQTAVTSLGQLMLRTSNAQTLAEALAEIDRVTTTLTQALAPQYEVKIREDAA